MCSNIRKFKTDFLIKQDFFWNFFFWDYCFKINYLQNNVYFHPASISVCPHFSKSCPKSPHIWEIIAKQRLFLELLLLRFLIQNVFLQHKLYPIPNNISVSPSFPKSCPDSPHVLQILKQNFFSKYYLWNFCLSDSLLKMNHLHNDVYHIPDFISVWPHFPKSCPESPLIWEILKQHFC